MNLETAASDEAEEFVDELKQGTELMLGQYTIEGFLAAGGFGITYLAKDSLNRRVVIKECFPGNYCRRQNASVIARSRAHQNELKSIIRLFSQEAMSLAKANHPNIVGVHQVFEENNTAYMALDYVQGRDLLEILQDDPDSLKPDLVEGYLTKVLDAIKHIHQLGILHRDLSPDNIIINELGEPILIDFGAAREAKDERVTRMLSALRVVKDGYSPQEFYIAGSDQPPSCDLYSLAASFYHIITRELPPDSQWRLSACAAGDPDPYVSLGEKTDAYSNRFVTALDKALEILPRDRMQSAEEWVDHLAGTTPIITKTTSRIISAVTPTAEKKSLMPILAGTTALVAAAGAGLFYFSTSGADDTAGTTEQNIEIAASNTPVVAAPTPEVAEPAPAPVEAAPEQAEAAPTVVEPALEPIETAPVLAEPAPEQAEPAPIVVEPAVELAETAPTPEIAAPVETPAEPATEAAEAAPIPTPEAPTLAETPTVDPAPEGDTLASTDTTEAAEPQPSIQEPNVAEVALEIAAMAAPIVADAPSLVIQPANSNLPSKFVVPQPRPLRNQVEALTEIEDAPPIVDTVAPAAPVEVAVIEPVETEQPPKADSDANAPIGADFFVALDKKAELEKADLEAATTPEATTAKPVIEATLDVASNSSVITRFITAVPFTLSTTQPGLIADVTDNAPEWLTADTQIVSVNGQPVETNAQINEKIEEFAAQADASDFELTLGMNAGLDGAAFERTLTIEKEQHTLLLNGLRFVSRKDGANWATEVAEAPSSLNFKVGDRLVSYVATWENLEGQNSLQEILVRDLASGVSRFNFAVSRDGEIWVEAFNLASLEN